MQLSIQGKQITITKTLHSHITEKIEKIVSHFGKVTDVHVVISVTKNQHTAEAMLNSKLITLHATGTAKDLYAAIDSMTNKLDRQLTKHKEKLADLGRGDEV